MVPAAEGAAEVIQPFTREDLKYGEAIVQQLHGLKGYDAWAECVAKAIAAERERCALILEHRAELMTNSLHFGDSSMMVHDTHRAARGLHHAADTIRG